MLSMKIDTNSKFIQHCLEKAKFQAAKSLNKNKHGAIIFKENQIISTGYNKMINLLSLKRYGYSRGTIHAESDAMLKCRFFCKGLNILVVREGKTRLKNSKPCSGCLAMMKEFGIDRVIFSDKDGELVDMELN